MKRAHNHGVTTAQFVMTVAERSLAELPIGRGRWGRRFLAFDEAEEDLILAHVLSTDRLPADVAKEAGCSKATLYAVLDRAARRHSVSCRFNRSLKEPLAPPDPSTDEEIYTDGR